MYLTVNSRFTPMSYEEAIKPLLNYKQAYDATEAMYDSLLTNVGTLKDSISSLSEDSPTRQAYEKYTEELTNAASELSKGLNEDTRKTLLDLKRKYATDIIPMEQSRQNLIDTIKYRQNLKAKDNSIEFLTDYNNIEDIMGVGTPDNTYISGKDLQTQVAIEAAAIGKQYAEDPEYRAILDGSKYQVMLHSGYSIEDIEAARDKDLATIPELADLYQRYQNSISGYSNREALSNYINSGMMSGLDTPKYDIINNPTYDGARSRLNKNIYDRNYANGKYTWDEFKEHLTESTYKGYYVNPDSGIVYEETETSGGNVGNYVGDVDDFNRAMRKQIEKDRDALTKKEEKENSRKSLMQSGVVLDWSGNYSEPYKPGKRRSNYEKVDIKNLGVQNIGETSVSNIIGKWLTEFNKGLKSDERFTIDDFNVYIMGPKRKDDNKRIVIIPKWLDVYSEEDDDYIKPEGKELNNEEPQNTTKEINPDDVYTLLNTNGFPNNGAWQPTPIDPNSNAGIN